MNILTEFELHERDVAFDREDTKHHRETCSPAGSCYIPFIENVRGEQHYCDRHRPEPTCESCSDTGRVPVWRMGWHGLEEATQKCKECSATGGDR
jgi:hypothetical protein